jgi:hypothetical protein
LRRARRHIDARNQLRQAHEMFAAMGPKASRNEHGSSCWPPGNALRRGPSRTATTLRPKRRRSRSLSVRARATARSPPSPSSAKAPSSTISTRSSESSASPRRHSWHGGCWRCGTDEHAARSKGSLTRAEVRTRRSGFSTPEVHLHAHD